MNPCLFFWWPVQQTPPLEIQTLCRQQVRPSTETPALQQQVQAIENQIDHQNLNDFFFEDLRARLVKKHENSQKKVWSRNEDQQLRILLSKGLPFDNILENFSQLPSSIIFRRVQRLRKMELKWPPKLDQLILDCVDEYKENWKAMSKYIRGKGPQFAFCSPKKLRQRYNYYLKPQLQQRPWSVEQELKLVRVVREGGLAWNEISLKFQGRSQLDVRNRYRGVLKPMVIKSLKNARNKIKRRQRNITA